MSALDHAASGRNRGRAGPRCLRGCSRNALGENETHGFFNSDFPVCNSSILETLGNPLIRVLVFLPDPHIRVCAIRSIGNLLSSASFFECGTNVKWRSLQGKHQDERSLAAPPANPGEVLQGRALHKENGVE